MPQAPNGDVAANQLPAEILLRVFDYLDASDLLNCIKVCSTWNMIGLDIYLWQRKLLKLLSTTWTILTCDIKPDYTPDFGDYQAQHPHVIYEFLINYAPQHLGIDCSKLFPLKNKPNSENTNSHRTSISEVMSGWWNHFRRRLSAGSPLRPHLIANLHCRYAVLGPGFDQRATSCLFSKLVNSRTKSFEPVTMIPGRMGFGAGLTLRLYSQAQIASFDSSFCPPKSRPFPTSQIPSPSNLPSSSSCSTTTTTAASPNQVRVDGKDNVGSACSSGLIHSACHRFEDFVFDLHYLYSLSGHLSHKFDSQLERIAASRLFVHTDPTTIPDLENLTVSEEMRNILSMLCGLIYAIDARETADQIGYLKHELRAILRGCPPAMANKIPIVILYIMPKEEINCHSQTLKNSTNNPNEVATLLNRDSYSGTNYTISWNGSLLLPLCFLNLFELENPWRLQKCASNDIKAIIQSVMWLRSRQPESHTNAHSVAMDTRL